MKKRFLSILCGLVVAVSTVSISVSAVEGSSQSYNLANNEPVVTNNLTTEKSVYSSGDIISLSTDVQTASSGSAELSAGESQDINVYLTTVIEDETSNSDGTSNSGETSQTNDTQSDTSGQSKNGQSSKSNPITGDVGFILPAIILIIAASVVLLLAYFVRKKRS